jgi:hypothetical protein
VLAARKTLLIMIALCGVCAVLVVAAVGLGSSRSDEEQTGVAPRSSLAADYSVDKVAPWYAPVSPEIVQATSRDSVALGLVAPESGSGASQTAGAADELDLAGAANAGASGEASPGASGAAASGHPASISTNSKSPFLDFRILLALIGVGGAVWLMNYLLRPSAD